MHTTPSGSWEGDIRLWKLDSKQRSFTLIGTVSAPGFVNSLQFVSPPRDSLHDYSWAQPDNAQKDAHPEPVPQTNGSTEPHPVAARGQAESLLLVAGMGQEPRLGRWMRLKEGAVNGARVFALHPRT